MYLTNPKEKQMKRIVFLMMVGVLIASCATKVPYTNKIKNEYELDEKTIKKVQFFTSSEIILYRGSSSGSKGTQTGGVLVESSRSKEDRIIIPPRTKCVVEKFGPNDELFVRFESGSGRYLSFKYREGSGGRYFLNATWKDGKGELQYANELYTASGASGNAFLLVQMKRLHETQRQDRIVKGVKVK